MTTTLAGALAVQTRIDRWPLREPFAIAREVMHEVAVVTVTLTDAGGRRGRGEAAGVDYDGETPEQLVRQINGVAARLWPGADAAEIAQLLPPGGARNALDAALLDLAAKATGVPAWRALGLATPRPLFTAVTIGLGSVAQTWQRASTWCASPLLKIKVDAEDPIATVAIVREAAPLARLVVDANEAWTVHELEQWMAPLHALGVELIEQPVPRGAEGALVDIDTVVPICADESCTDRASLDRLAGRYQAVNVKLDKCGGLREGLALVAEAKRRGLEVMVGNMCGSSLAMAPAFLLAQHARWVDLDGPLLQRGDRTHAMRYDGALVHPPEPALWG